MYSLHTVILTAEQDSGMDEIRAWPAVFGQTEYLCGEDVDNANLVEQNTVGVAAD